MKRKVGVGISVSLDLLEKIDQKRRDKTRSEFVVNLIKKALENKSACETVRDELFFK
jgi:metal-responsive CopG/Arc/MetJ family transcriptional regulator